MRTPTANELESSLEARLRMKVRAIGGRLEKLAPTRKGIPDRMVLLPGGRIALVELKTVNGELSPKQILVHREYAALGVHVTVLTGREEIDSWVRQQARYADPKQRLNQQKRKPQPKEPAL